MTRFPFGFLLWMINLGLAGGIGWFFYEAMKQEQHPSREQMLAQIKRDAVRLNKRDDKPKVAQSTSAALREANFHGEPPPKPEPKGKDPDDEPVKPEPSDTPLDQIFSVRMLYAAGNKSWVVVEYKPEVNMRPPAGARGQLGAGADVVPRAPQRNNRPGIPGRPNTRPTPLPVGNPNSGPVQFLTLEEPDEAKLWAPFDHIRLIEVAEDASYARFRRENKPEDQRDPEGEIMIPASLGLSNEMQIRLAKLSGKGALGQPAQATQTQRPQVTQPQASAWVPTESTRKVEGTNKWDIGSNDIDSIRSNPSQVFNSDIKVGSYTSPDGRYRGVVINDISPRYQSFGVQRGDVILSVNGESVSNKSQAISVGKRLYNRGVRVFEVEVLTVRGLKETRTYRAPDEK